MCSLLPPYGKLIKTHFSILKHDTVVIENFNKTNGGVYSRRSGEISWLDLTRQFRGRQPRWGIHAIFPMMEEPKNLRYESQNAWNGKVKGRTDGDDFSEANALVKHPWIFWFYAVALPWEGFRVGITLPKPIERPMKTGRTQLNNQF